MAARLPELRGADVSNLKDIVPQVELDIEGSVVVIELHCSDAYAARVLFDDIAQRITSGTMVLRLAGERIMEGENANGQSQ